MRLASPPPLLWYEVLLPASLELGRPHFRFKRWERVFLASARRS